MSDAASLGWCEARVARSRSLYRRLLGLNLLMHLAIGLACIFAPYWVSRLLELPVPVPDGWVRGWGATLLLVTALYLPGLVDPDRHRMPNIIGLLGRVWMAIIWVVCGGGFLWFALFDFVWAVILAAAYLSLFRNVVTSRP